MWLQRGMRVLAPSARVGETGCDAGLGAPVKLTQTLDIAQDDSNHSPSLVGCERVCLVLRQVEEEPAP